MALRGKRTFLLHYQDSKTVKLDEVDGDEFCFIDLVKEIEEKTGLLEYEISYMADGKKIPITKDADLLVMWDQITAIRGVYHLFLVTTQPQHTLTNKYSRTDAIETLPPCINTTTNSPNSASLDLYHSKFTYFSSKSSLLSTPKSKKNPSLSEVIRRSPRLANKWRPKFTSKEPVVVSDSESEEQNFINSSKVQSSKGDVLDVSKLANNINILDVDDDWAVRHLIETTYGKSIHFADDENEPPTGEFVPELLDVLTQSHKLGFDAANPEENYHSDSASSGEHENYFGSDASDDDPYQDDDAASEDVDDSGSDRSESQISEVINRKRKQNISDFIVETEKLQDKDEAGHSLPANDVTDLFPMQTWPTMWVCKKWMRDLAIDRKFEYKQKKNDKLRVRLVCKDSNCPWFVNVRKLPHEHTAKIRKFNPEHIYVQAEIWEKKGVRISYHTAYESRIICHERIFGSYAAGYKLVPEIARQIQLKNPGSVVEWQRSPEDRSFISLTLAFKASLDGFINGCRPLLGLDGAFLKGKYGGVVLAVTALDGNNGLFPIGIMVCKTEDYYNWSKFLEKLKPHLDKHKDLLTFISDRSKGLRDAVMMQFPGSRYRFCMRHFYKNFKNYHASHKGVQMENLVWGAARAYRKEEFEQWRELLVKHDKENTAIPYLQSEPFEGWCRSFFDTTCKAEHITSNFCESFNKMILFLRDMPLPKLIESYAVLVMGLLYDRRVKSQLMNPDGVVERVEDQIADVKKRYNKYTTNGSTEYLHVCSNRHGNTWTVNLQEHTCTCGRWQIEGIPCVHAISVILPMRVDWRRYCSDFFSVTSYQAVYNGHVVPIEDSTFWPKCFGTKVAL